MKWTETSQMASFFWTTIAWLTGLMMAKSSNHSIPVGASTNCGELVFIYGVWNETMYENVIALRLEKNDDESKITFLLANRTNDYSMCILHLIWVPNNLLRPFSISKRKSITQSTLNWNDRSVIRGMNEQHMSMPLNYSSGCVFDLCLANAVHRCGLSGFCYSANHLLKSHAISALLFWQFHHRYLQFNLSPFQGGAALVKIRALKHQKDSALQMRAAHLSNSFGQIIQNVSIRHNSRNQIEYPVQSLLNPKMKLRIRPKYLQQISKLIIHKISKSCTFSQFQSLVYGLVKGKDRNVLFLPHVQKGPNIGNPLSRFSLLMFQMQNKGKENVINDIGIRSFCVMSRIHNGLSSDNVIELYKCFPFQLDKAIWLRAMEEFKKIVVVPKQKALVKTVNNVFKMHYDKLMRIGCDKAINFADPFKWDTKMEKDFCKSLKHSHHFYASLLGDIATEIMHSIFAMHPDYLNEIKWGDETTTITAVSLGNKLRKLYQISAVQSYFKANAKGRDLHIVCFGDEKEGMLQNLTAALSDRINTEWNINDTFVSQMVSNNIIQKHQH